MRASADSAAMLFRTELGRAMLRSVDYNFLRGEADRKLDRQLYACLIVPLMAAPVYDGRTVCYGFEDDDPLPNLFM